jgi:hypothetical protein
MATPTGKTKMGNRSFDLVDYKIAEAEFFLQRLDLADADIFAAGCYFNAFVSAARSVTFSLQTVLSHGPGFTDWYAAHQSRLRSDTVARFFHDVRRVGQHIGTSPLRGGSGGPGRPWMYHFTPCDDFPVVPDIDVVSACRQYMVLLVDIVFDCYINFGELIDPHQYYTNEAFEKRGQTIEHALAEVFGYPLSTIPPHVPMEYVWQMIRDSMPGCRIDDLFEKYLAKARPGPVRLEPPSADSFVLPPGWTRKDEWLLPPGYDSVEGYLNDRKAGNAPPNW